MLGEACRQLHYPVLKNKIKSGELEVAMSIHAKLIWKESTTRVQWT